MTPIQEDLAVSFSPRAGEEGHLADPRGSCRSKKTLTQARAWAKAQTLGWHDGLRFNVDLLKTPTGIRPEETPAITAANILDATAGHMSTEEMLSRVVGFWQTWRKNCLHFWIDFRDGVEATLDTNAGVLEWKLPTHQ